jgi:polyisoprenoid-binding protein YceI
MFRRFALALVCAALLAVPAQAQEGTYALDPVHSVAVFKIKHLNVSYTYGLFPNLAGEFYYDPEDPTANTIQVTAPVPDMTTEHEGRDTHLQNEDFLNATEFGEVSFTSTAWEELSPGKFKVTGNLTLLAVTKEVTVLAEFVGCGEGREGEKRCGFDAKLTINRSDFGMDLMVGPVGDEVTLMIGIEGIQQ